MSGKSGDTLDWITHTLRWILNCQNKHFLRINKSEGHIESVFHKYLNDLKILQKNAWAIEKFGWFCFGFMTYQTL